MLELLAVVEGDELGVVGLGDDWNVVVVWSLIDEHTRTDAWLVHNARVVVTDRLELVVHRALHFSSFHLVVFESLSRELRPEHQLVRIHLLDDWLLDAL